jgi:sugar phosphate isomerase/epimerase
MEDTILRRRLPGEGAFDLTGLIGTLDAIGVDAPTSVEVISTEQQARPVVEAARRAHDTTRAVLRHARTNSGP